jgi:hypothetical protein
MWMEKACLEVVPESISEDGMSEAEKEKSE